MYVFLRFARSDAVGVVGTYVVVKGLELSALLPRQHVDKMVRRIALIVVGYPLIDVLCKYTVLINECNAPLSKHIAIIT